MENEILDVIMPITGTVILILIGIIGFFTSRLVTDVKRTTTEVGKNKGKIELVQQQQQNDVKRIEERTQLELANMSKSISALSDNVSMLCKAMAQHNIKTEH